MMRFVSAARRSWPKSRRNRWDEIEYYFVSVKWQEASKWQNGERHRFPCFDTRKSYSQGLERHDCAT